MILFIYFHFRLNLKLLLFSSRLIVDLKPPSFLPLSVELKPPRKTVLYESLNETQKAAIERVRRSRDYTLILGMPGK